jgi:iron complex transport system substrate-binding protein
MKQNYSGNKGKRIGLTWLYYSMLLLWWWSAMSCTPEKRRHSADTGAGSETAVRLSPRYAKGFDVVSYNGYKLVEVRDPLQENETVYRYALVSDSARAGDVPEDYVVIPVPVKSVICMTTLQLSNFIKLGATDRVTGMPSTHYLFNEEMKQRIREKRTSKIGIEGNFDNELILALRPDLILVSPFKRGGYDALTDMGIPLVCFLGYKENSPLGQAEWLKFTGLLLGMEAQAEELFRGIEARYNALKQLTDGIKDRPSVLSGEMRSGNWYVVGGQSYLAQLFRDAGATYFLEDNQATGGMNLDFESVYSQGAEADYWRLLVSHTGDYSYEALRQNDARYADFRAFRERKIVYCNLRQKPFYENTPVEPDVVLADLIKAFHPDLLPDHTPMYYELLH